MNKPFQILAIDLVPGKTPEDIAVLVTELQAKRDNEYACAILEEALKLYPRNAELHYRMGRTLIHIYNEAQHRNQSRRDRVRPLSAVEAEAMHQQALAHLKTAAALAPHEHVYTFNAAVAARIGNDPLAEDYILRALVLRPDHPFSWVEMGRLSLKTDKGKAIACFQNAARLNHENLVPQQELKKLGIAPDLYGAVDYTVANLASRRAENSHSSAPAPALP